MDPERDSNPVTSWKSPEGKKKKKSIVSQRHPRGDPPMEGAGSEISLDSWLPFNIG